MTIGGINREIKWAVASGNASLAIHWARVRENYLRSKLGWRVKFKEGQSDDQR